MKNDNNKKKLFIIIFSIIIVLLVGLFFIIHGIINIELNDNNDNSIPVNTQYVDKGIKVKKNGSLLNKNKYVLNINNSVNTNTLGDYTVTYEIKYLWNKFTKKRLVHVIDNIKPEININVDTIEKDYCTNELLTEYEYSAIDNYDGDITSNVNIIDKDQEIIFSVKDNSGNLTELTLPLVIKKNDPVFKLNGSSTIYIGLNEKYYEQGVINKDECGKDIDEKVNITGSVDTSKEGTYTITYTIGDKSISRKVIVEKYDTNKTIYLTFDDGPGVYTERVLSILDKYNVKATFFVTHQFANYGYLIKKEYESGHAIGVHSYTHNWNIYKSVDTYLDDFNKMNNDIKNYTGTETRLFRFPGGSSNTISRNYSSGIMQSLATRMTNDGYVYFDWDIDSSDAAGGSMDSIYNNVISGAKRCSQCVILMHDIKYNTVNKLDDILSTLTSRGYKFGTLTTSSPTAHQRIVN